jgi:hypothetical protein
MIAVCHACHCEIHGKKTDVTELAFKATCRKCSEETTGSRISMTA